MLPPLTQGARSPGSRPAHTAHSRLLNCAPAPAWSQTGAWCCGQRQAGTLGSVATPTTHSTCLQYRRLFFLDNLHSAMIYRGARLCGLVLVAPAGLPLVTVAALGEVAELLEAAQLVHAPGAVRGEGGGGAQQRGEEREQQQRARGHGGRLAPEQHQAPGTGGAVINYWVSCTQISHTLIFCVAQCNM